MFLLNGKHLPEGTSFYDANGTQYPSGWLNQATEEQKAAIGITWVADQAPIDTRFYWDANLPKALEDKLEEDGSTTKGLKSTFCNRYNFIIFIHIYNYYTTCISSSFSNWTSVLGEERDRGEL